MLLLNEFLVTCYDYRLSKASSNKAFSLLLEIEICNLKPSLVIYKITVHLFWQHRFKLVYKLLCLNNTTLSSTYTNKP